MNTVLEIIPVIVTVKDIELFDKITESLTTLCPHRHKLEFMHDFAYESDILPVWDEEKHNPEVRRSVVCGLYNSRSIVMSRISHFTGWILAVPLDSESTLQHVIKLILENSLNCGILRVDSSSPVSFSLAKSSEKSLKVERAILNRTIERRNESIEEIRKVISKNLHGYERISLMDQEKIAQDIFEEEINSYVHAARRAVVLLFRVLVARKDGVSTTLKEEDIFKAIRFDDGDLQDLIRFIKSEWYLDFADCVDY